MPPKKRLADEIEEEGIKEEDLQPRTTSDDMYEQNGAAIFARKMLDEQREETKKKQFIHDYVTPLHESEMFTGSQNARMFVAKWDEEMSEAEIPMKQRTDIFMMLLSKVVKMKLKDDLAYAKVHKADWLTVRLRFEALFKPKMNSGLNDTTTWQKVQQGVAENTSNFAVRWRANLLNSPMADNLEMKDLTEKFKWTFVTGLRPALQEPLRQQINTMAATTKNCEQPSWYDLVQMAQDIEASTTMPEELARVRIESPKEQRKSQIKKQQIEIACWRCGGPHMREKCRYPPNISCTTCGRKGHMMKVCRQNRMTKSRRPNYKQRKPTQTGAAVTAAGTTSTEEEDEEASWNAALKASVHLVDMIKPTTALLVVALIMVCTPAVAATTAQLKEATVFPIGLTLCEPPIGGGHLVAIPQLPQCHKAMGPPIDNVSIRLFARKHKSQQGNLFAMQRIEITRCTHLNWLFSTTVFPDQSVQEALEPSEVEMIEDAIVATKGDSNHRPSSFYSGKQQFQREAETNVWMTRNEVRYATNYLRYQTCVTTINYAFVIGQYTLYDTLTMTSDVTDLEGIDYKAGRATTGQFTLRWNADESQNMMNAIRCPYLQVQHGTATLQGHRLIIENPKMAFEIAATPIEELCVSDKLLWPSTVCCYLVEFNTTDDEEMKPVVPKVKMEGAAKEDKISQKWWDNLHDKVLDEIDTVSEYVLARQDREELKTRAAEQLAECNMQRMLQQLTQEQMLMDPTLAIRLLTGDNTLAATHVGPMTMQVYKCRIVKEFQIWWDGMDSKGKCYKMAPVTLKDGRQFYLKPGAKELVPDAREIKCEDRPKFVYEISPHKFATTKATQVVHAIPSMFDYEHTDDENFMRMNTDHLYTAQVITGLTMEDSILKQAQQLHEQKKLQRQVERLMHVVADYKLDGHILVKEEDMTQEKDGGWLAWIASKATGGIGQVAYEVLKAPVRYAIKIVLAILTLLTMALLLRYAPSCCRARKRWCKRRSRGRNSTTLTTNGRRPACRNCGARGHITADCIHKARDISPATEPLAITYPTSMAIVMAAMMSGCAASTNNATLWPVTTPFALCKVESPLIPIVFTPRRGQKAETNAIIDTGATVSVCPENLVDKFGWTGATDKARQPLSLIGVGQKEAKGFVEGALRIGDAELPNVRLWIAPISLTKVLLGNDVLSKVAKIELEYGNLRRFQVATAQRKAKKTEPPTNPDLVKKAVEHLTKLRTMDFGDTTLNAETQDKLRDLMVKWARIFPRDDKDIGYNNSMPMNIDTGDARPIAQAVRRVPYALRESLEKKLQTWTDMGILVHDDTCEWASPVFALPKKEPGEVNLICDYRKLNAVTKLGTQIIDNMQEMLDTAATWKYIVTLDMRQSYAQCALTTEAQKKAALATTLGVLRPTRVQFGLKGAPAHFTRLVRSLLRGIPNVQTYIDDCVYGAMTQEELLKITDQVFERFAEANLRLNPKKSQFGRRTTTILGHEITENGLRPQQTKLDVVKHWPTPTDAQQLRKFLGLTNFFRKFVAQYAAKAAILEKLVRDAIQDKKLYQWTEDHQTAFKQLKHELQNAPCLTHPSRRETDTYYIFVDASNWAIGAVLTLLNESMQAYQPVGAFSKKFTATEQRYSTIERELLGVLRALNHWAIYIWGHPIVVFTDHKPIVALMRSKGGASGPLGITNRLETFLQRVAPFNVEVRYIEGLKNTAADALSRIPQDAVVETKEEGKEECTALPVMTRNQSRAQKSWPEKVRQELREQQQADAEIKEVAKYFKKRPRMTNAERIPYTTWDANFDMIDGIVVWTGKGKMMPYIPQSMRSKILKALHAAPLAGHKGGQKLYADLAKVAYWPGMYKAAHKYAAECISCQRYKADRTGLKGVYGEYPIPPFIFHTVHADFTGTIHGADEQHVVMTFIDALSRYFIAVPTKNSTAETAARVFVTEIICKFGSPQVLITDNGTSFTAELFEHVCKILEVTHLTVAPYAPQSNGSIERMHQTMKTILRQEVSRGGADWKEKLPLVVGAMNHQPQASGLSPTEIVFGRSPTIPTDWTPILEAQAPPPVHLKDYFEMLQSERIAKMIQQASYREEESQRRREKQAERVQKPLKVGDLVLYRDLKVRCTKNMHSPLYAGPAEIVKISGATVKLRPLPTGVHNNKRPRKQDKVKGFRILMSELKPYVGDPQRDHRMEADYQNARASRIMELGALDTDDDPEELIAMSTDEVLELFNKAEERQRREDK